MEHFVHFIQRENIAIFKRRLAETKDVAMRGVLLQLLAEEQAKDVTPKSEVRSPRLAAPFISS